MTIFDWLIVALFLGTLMAIGYAFSRRNKDVEDYFVAGRSMPGWIVAIAATGTTISAGTFVGSPELGFNTDLTYVLNLLGAIVGGMLVAALIMPKLYKANTITIYGFIGQVDYLVKKFREELHAPDALVVATGGMALMVAQEDGIIDKLDGFLTIKGLRLLYERNR